MRNKYFSFLEELCSLYPEEWYSTLFDVYRWDTWGEHPQLLSLLLEGEFVELSEFAAGMYILNNAGDRLFKFIKEMDRLFHVN